MSFSGATITRLGPIGVQILVDSGGGGGGAPTDAIYLTGAANGSLSAERVVRAVSGLLIDSTNAGFFDIGLVTPVSVASGGIGASTLTAFGMLYGSGGSAVQVLPAMSGGALVIGSGVNFRPHILNTAGQGQYLITSGGVVGGLAWVNTAAGGGATTKTIRIPFALLTVQPDSANAFWISTTGTNVDMAAVRFADSGEGIATYWSLVPQNLATTPAWNLDFYSKMPSATAANSAMVTTRAKAVADGEDADASAYTIVSSAGLYRIFRATTLTVSAVSGGNFDSVVSLTTNDMLLVEVDRHGGNSSDSLSDAWDLCSLVMRVDVTG
jgi:hypothetical protein